MNNITMSQLLQYTLEVSLCWTMLYLVFFACLRKETYFSINRWYLLSAILIGILIPFLRFIDYDFGQNGLAEALPLVYLIQNAPGQIISLTEQNSHWDFGKPLITFYLFGLLFFTYRFVHSLLRIKSLYINGIKFKKQEHTLIETKAFHLPFSFMHFVFVSDIVVLGKSMDRIIHHELAHVRHRHTIDVLFLEIINIFFWWNPLVYLYKTALRQTHEYLADATVLKNTSKKIYGKMLLTQSMSGLEIALAHQFFHSHIKKRINMMYQKQSGPSAWLKYALALPVLLFLTVVFAKTQDKLNAHSASTTDKMETSTLSDTSKNREIFKVVEEMPRFPGCEELTDDFAKDECSKKKLLEHIINRVKYPDEARKNGVVGRVFVRFIVEKDGSITNATIVRDIGAGCGQAALDVVNSWNQMPEKWTPGRQRGQAVAVMYTIPFTFSLDQKKEGGTKIKTPREKVLLKEYNSNNSSPDGKLGSGLKPLLVIDGKIAPSQNIEDINIDEIHTMNVLKGEKALQKYSTKGKNGVIEITTELKNAKKNTSAIFEPNDNSKTKYKIEKEVEIMPLFNQFNPDTNPVEKENQAQTNLLKYIAANTKYPKEAYDRGIEGKVFVKFMVNTSGMIIDPTIARSLDKSCDKEVLRMIANMNNDLAQPFIPGYKNGKKVNTEMVIPVSFKIDANQIKQQPGISIKHLGMDGQINFEYSTPNAGLGNIFITDMQGKTLASYKENFQKGVNNSNNSFGIHLVRGIYIISIDQSGNIISEKVQVR